MALVIITLQDAPDGTVDMYLIGEPDLNKVIEGTATDAQKTALKMLQAGNPQEEQPLILTGIDPRAAEGRIITDLDDFDEN